MQRSYSRVNLFGQFVKLGSSESVLYYNFNWIFLLESEYVTWRYALLIRGLFVILFTFLLNLENVLKILYN